MVPARALAGQRWAAPACTRLATQTLPNTCPIRAAAMWNNPHMLVLDEPTNYLDRESLGALAAGITDFGGAVVMISHNSGEALTFFQPVFF